MTHQCRLVVGKTHTILMSDVDSGGAVQLWGQGAHGKSLCLPSLFICQFEKPALKKLSLFEKESETKFQALHSVNDTAVHRMMRVNGQWHTHTGASYRHSLQPTWPPEECTEGGPGLPALEQVSKSHASQNRRLTSLQWGTSVIALS